MYIVWAIYNHVLVWCVCRNKSAKLKANYIREYFSGDAEVDMQMIGPVVGGSAVLM